MATDIICGLLERSGEYMRLREALERSEGPLSVFGLGEAHRLHTLAALYRGSKEAVLLVEPSQLAANKAHEELLHYVPDALLFPARELPLA
ncbi:MAG: hypothetical protein II536_00615, partial [Clostridia bacterium]|nr:hypothetical protein [Clostridia bacterium]